MSEEKEYWELSSKEKLIMYSRDIEHLIKNASESVETITLKQIGELTDVLYSLSSYFDSFLCELEAELEEEEGKILWCTKCNRVAKYAPFHNNPYYHKQYLKFINNELDANKQK